MTPLVSFLHLKFIDFAKTTRSEARKFDVLSHHGWNGKIINNARLADGSLRPTENQTNADRCPANLMYANLSYVPLLIDIDAMSISAYPFSFFVQFPTKQNIVVPNSMANYMNFDYFAPWSCQL
jgi:hypothetical protein